MSKSIGKKMMRISQSGMFLSHFTKTFTNMTVLFKYVKKRLARIPKMAGPGFVWPKFTYVKVLLNKRQKRMRWG